MGMVRPFEIIFATLICGSIGACDDSGTVSLTRSTKIGERLYDAPVKTQIVMKISISPPAHREKVSAALSEAWRVARSRSGFKYRSRASHIYIYVFLDGQPYKDIAARAGMLSWHAPESEPSIAYNPPPPRSIPARRFGLSLGQRKELYRENILAERRSLDVAYKRHPTDGRKQADVAHELLNRYRSNLLKKYKITTSQLMAILGEGLKHRWPRP